MGGDDLHPFIQGLLRELPKANSNWSISDRAKWLRLAVSAFDLIYEGDGTISIDAAQSKRERDDGIINPPPLN